MIIFVQPFGLQSPFGGARILRALLADAPLPFLSVCTSPLPPPRTTIGPEIHLPIRPHFGRIESTRFAGLAWRTQPLFLGRFVRELERICREMNATAINAIPHGLEFWYAFKIARKLGILYSINVHDELQYNLQGRPELPEAQRRLGEVWCAAGARIVISEPMGEEYCRRYGRRKWITVTDGLETVAPGPVERPAGSLRVYFMGALHNSYEGNFRALLKALDKVNQNSPGSTVSLTCRGSTVPRENVGFPVFHLPWAPESEVASDLINADLLYFPLPFAAEHAPFYRFSLSTKMVTYLGSGIPILFHGPKDSAACRLLIENSAAVVSNSVKSEDLAVTLLEHVRTEAHDDIVCNALALARDQFMIDEQRKRFWNALSAVE